MSKLDTPVEDTEPVTQMGGITDNNTGKPLPDHGELPPIAPLPSPSLHVVDGSGEKRAVDADTGESPSDAPGNNSTGVSHAQSGGQKSPSGETWDETIHENPPRIAIRSGSWARIRGGKRQGSGPKTDDTQHTSKAVSYAKPINSTAPSGTGDTSSPVDYAALGDFCAATTFSIAVVLGGDDFNAEDGEHKMLAGGFARYAQAKNWADIPPGVGLCLIGVSILAKRIHRPGVKVRALAAWLWIKKTIAWMKEPIRD